MRRPLNLIEVRDTLEAVKRRLGEIDPKTYDQLDYQSGLAGLIASTAGGSGGDDVIEVALTALGLDSDGSNIPWLLSSWPTIQWPGELGDRWGRAATYKDRVQIAQDAIDEYMKREGL